VKDVARLCADAVLTRVARAKIDGTIMIGTCHEDGGTGGQVQPFIRTQDTYRLSKFVK